MSKALKTVEPVQVPATQADPVLSMLERISTDPSVSIERVEQAFAFYQKVEADRARKEFTAAMIAAQMEMEPIRKDANNPQTRSKYASFEALDRAARPVYTKHGFVCTYRIDDSPKPDHVKVVCTVMHKAGHERDYPADMPADGKGAKGGDVMTKTHATGSAVSYGMRYLLKMIFNIAVSDKDDDGNSASDSGATVNQVQLNELIALADEVGADKAAFCKYMGVESFAALPAKSYDRAKAALNRKRAAK